MKIPLPGLMRHWREEEFSAGDTPLALPAGPQGLGGGGEAAAPLSRAGAHRHASARARWASARRRSAGCRFAGGWTKHRDLAAPQSRTFQALWADTKAGVPQMTRRGRRRATRSSLKIRRALGTYDSAARRRAVAERLGTPPPPLVPERAKQQTRSSCAACSANSSKVSRRPSSRWRAPPTFPPRSRASCAPPTCRCGCASATTPISTRCAWGRASPRSSAAKARPSATTRWASAMHAAAVAETGTLVLASGRRQSGDAQLPARDAHRRRRGQGPGRRLRGAWDKIRARFGRRAMPRTVNFVSGPSRTADIGGQLVMGAHGPRRLCVILVREVWVASRQLVGSRRASVCGRKSRQRGPACRLEPRLGAQLPSRSWMRTCSLPHLGVAEVARRLICTWTQQDGVNCDP